MRNEMINSKIKNNEVKDSILFNYKEITTSSNKENFRAISEKPSDRK
jgi:hypothetical protein